MFKHHRLHRACAAAQAALAAVVIAAGLAQSAQAATQVVDFENLPSGTQITDQYRDVGGAGNGVVFGPRRDGSMGDVPLISDVGGLARSGSRIAWTYCTGAGDMGCPSYTISGKFLSPQTGSVTIYVGNDLARSVPVRFTGYTLGGQQTASVSTILQGGTRYAIPLTLRPKAGEEIVWFELAMAEGKFDQYYFGVGFDDLTFETPDTPPGPAPTPSPRFGFGRVGDRVDLGLKRGSSTSVTFAVNRTGGSTEPIAFSVSGLPPGVSASFEPQQPTAASTVKLTLTAAPDAPDVDSVPLRVTAAPAGPQAGSCAAPCAETLSLNVRSDYDVRVLAMEVLQAVQRVDSRKLGGASGPYTGVPLVETKKTVVRVYAEALAAPPGGVPNVTAFLTASREGKRVGSAQGFTLSPDAGSRTVHEPIFERVGLLTPASRADPSRAFMFTLPPEWTKGTITLTVRLFDPAQHGLVLDAAAPGACRTPACVANDSSSLTDVAFNRIRSLGVRPFKMSYTRDGNLHEPPDPDDAFSATREAVPVDLQVPASYAGTIDVTEIDKRTATEQEKDARLAELNAKKDDDPEKTSLTPGEISDLEVGLKTGDMQAELAKRASADDPFLTVGVSKDILNGLWWPQGNKDQALVDSGRPLTSVAHEAVHALGRRHADTACDGDGDDGSGSDPWPDPYGYTAGIALDTRVQPYALQVDNVGASPPATPEVHPHPGRVYDFMSYCAGESSTWLSPLSWTAVVTRYRFGRPSTEERPEPPKPQPQPPIFGAAARGAAAGGAAAGGAAARGAAARGAAANGSAVRVTAFRLGSLPVDMTSVEPGTGGPVTGAPSALRLVLRDAAGRIVSQAPMAEQRTHADHVGPLSILVGAAPVAPGGATPRAAASASVSSAEIVDGQAVVAKRVRSAHAPAVRVLAPKRGAVVGGKRRAVIRWSARDADASDRLEVTVEYSADGGRHWRTIFGGPNRSRLSLPAGALARSQRGRALVRIRVNDGFNETVATSRHFTAQGAAPTVRISSPKARTRVAADGTLYLDGSAYDDSGRPITGRRLAWFAGSRRLGYGERISATGLRPGTNRIRLVARDRYRRTRHASVNVRVRAVRPLFLVLRAPKAVSRRARVIWLNVASTTAASLRVGGSRFTVGRRVRQIAIPVRPGTTSARLKLTLSSGGKTSRMSLTIRRR